MSTPAIETFIQSLTLNAKSFGAKGDARKVTDGVLIGTTVTSATACFTPADAGRTIWARQGDGTLSLARTTVVSVESATSITVADAASGSWTGAHVVIGTDDTEAIKSLVAEVESRPNRGTIFIPAGGYITTETPFVFTADPVNEALPSIVGEGSGNTVFFPAPDSTLHNSAFVFNYDTLGGRKRMEGFTIDGACNVFTAAQVLYFSSSANGNVLRDVRVVNCLGIFAALYVSALTTAHHCHFESGGIGAYSNGDLHFVDTYAGNCQSAAVAVANGAFTMRGGVLDESGGGTLVLQNSRAKLASALLYGLTNKTVVALDGTSTLRAFASDLIPFDSHPGVTALRLAAGAVAYLTQCTLIGTTTGHGLNNEGTVYDGGNNPPTTKAGSGTITTLTL